MAGPTHEARAKQVIIAVAVLAGVTCVAVGLLLTWRQVPGLLGEWLGMVVGIMSTPFFLEASFVIVGVLVVLVANAVRRHREGDEFVGLDELHEHRPPSPDATPPPAPNRKPPGGSA